jgi:hypothetical protein
MAYVRCGRDSDVYLFGSKDTLELYLAYNRGSANKVPHPGVGAPKEKYEEWLNDVKPWNHPECGKSYKFTSRQACIDKLVELQKNAVMVPQEAIDRLRQELVEKGDEYRI